MSSSSIACTVEPYRRGNSFNDWYTRLKYFFKVNKVKDEDKMAYFITLSGPVIFEEIKLLYPTGNFEEIPFDDLINKLKNRLDKIDPDLVQRYKFSTRVQQPDETTEDFVLALKLQAEFCGFENFKEVAVLDRIIAGLRDKNLRQKLLSEEKLKLASAEKIIATWEVAKANAGTAETSRDSPNMVAAIGNYSGRESGMAMRKLAKVYGGINDYQREEVGGEASGSRGPVKNRLGYRPYGRTDQTGRGRQNSGSAGRRGEMYARQRPDYSQMVCNYCGIKGHIKKKCFKLKNLHRDAVNLVESYKPGPSANGHINELLSRMWTRDSEDDDKDTDTHWKRQRNGSSDADQDL